MIECITKLFEELFIIKYLIYPLGLVLFFVIGYFFVKFAITEIYFTFIKRKLQIKEGTVILLTGGSNGIGLDLSYLLANNHGKNISLIILDVMENKEQINLLKQKCKSAEYIFCDLSDKKQVELTFQSILNKYNSVDILINNAAVALIEYFDALAISRFFKAEQINLLSYMQLTQLFLNQKHFENGRAKSIVFMGSVAGFQVGLKTTEYASSKFGLVMFNEALRGELKTQDKFKNVQLTIINPYQVDTELFKGFTTIFKKLMPTLNVQKVSNTVYTSLIQKRNIVFINWHYEILIYIVSNLPVWGKDFVGLISLRYTVKNLVGKQDKFPGEVKK